MGLEFSPTQGGWYQAQRINKTPHFFRIPEDTQKVRVAGNDGQNHEISIVQQRNLVTDVIFDPDTGNIYNPNGKQVRARIFNGSFV